ncbi:hypothetical protein FHW96_003775 [Novosphingobium sp. SG751A]|nr:hypothetical protein [Novosphingobium sp. SG751A]
MTRRKSSASDAFFCLDRRFKRFFTIGRHYGAHPWGLLRPHPAKTRKILPPSLKTDRPPPFLAL